MDNECIYNREKECDGCNDRCPGNPNCKSQEEQDYEDWKSVQ